MLCFSLLIAASITASHASDSCGAAAISIPIQDTKVLEDVKESYMIGLRMKLGTPPQDILMLPWSELNNTWVYDYQPYCDNEAVIRNDLICRVRRGDYFFENASSTYSRATNMRAAGGALQETTYLGAETGIPNLISSSISGTDVIDMGSANVTSFPIGIPRLYWDHGYTTLHSLGLGSNSTFLDGLFRAGQIASHSWSIFWGRMWVDDWIDGSLVLGGYNSKLAVGNNYTQALEYSDNDKTGCYTGMKVTITGIDLNFSNGSNVNIFEDALPICIAPQRQLLIEGPHTIREAFEDATGMVSYGDSSQGLHWSAVQYLADGAYDGDMTITLSSGMAVRIPNSQFLPPYVDVADDGSRIYNNSIRELLYHGVGNAPATLGRYFFTSAHLTVNHDTNSFTLSEARATTDSELVPIVSDSRSQGCSDGTSGTGTQATATATATADSGGTGRTPTAAIAGGVVGGVVAVLAAAGIAAFILRRRRRRQRTAYELPGGSGTHQDVSAQGARTDENNNEDKWPKTHELGVYERPSELSGNVLQGRQNPGPVYELSNDTQTVYEVGHGR